MQPPVLVLPSFSFILAIVDADAVVICGRTTISISFSDEVTSGAGGRNPVAVVAVVVVAVVVVAVTDDDDGGCVVVCAVFPGDSCNGEGYQLTFFFAPLLFVLPLSLLLVRRDDISLDPMTASTARVPAMTVVVNVVPSLLLLLLPLLMLYGRGDGRRMGKIGASLQTKSACNVVLDKLLRGGSSGVVIVDRGDDDISDDDDDADADDAIDTDADDDDDAEVDADADDVHDFEVTDDIVRLLDEKIGGGAIMDDISPSLLTTTLLALTVRQDDIDEMEDTRLRSDE